MKTKKILLLSLLSMMLIKVYGQPYKSIFSDGMTLWYSYECAADAGGTIAYYTDSDTTINDKQYFKLYRELIYSPNQTIGLDNELCGFVYEDTLSGKYWFRKLINGVFKEALFMDLSLNVGDSMAIIYDFRFMWVDSVVVESVDYENERKIVTVNSLHYDCYDGYKIKYMEGIGASNAFYMAEYDELPHPYTLICKFENGEQVYSHKPEFFENCFHSGGGSVEDNDFGRHITVFPNPSSNNVNIKLLDPSISELKYDVYNSMGSRIKSGRIETLDYELSFDSNGAYFIVFSNNKYKTVKKIIINGY